MSSCSEREWQDWYEAIYLGRTKIVPPWKKHLIEKWSGLPSSIARSLRVPVGLMDDAVSEGLTKLCEVAIAYDWKRAEFSTIAVIALQRALSTWLRRTTNKTFRERSLSGFHAAEPDESFADMEEKENLCNRVRKVLHNCEHGDILAQVYGIGGDRTTLEAIALRTKVPPRTLSLWKAVAVRSFSEAWRGS